jgi:hypothetical protein
MRYLAGRFSVAAITFALLGCSDSGEPASPPPIAAAGAPNAGGGAGSAMRGDGDGLAGTEPNEDAGSDASGGVGESGTTNDAAMLADAGPFDGGNTGCAAVPVVPNATPQTRKVLCYLHSVYGNHILSGQEENNDDNGMNTVFQATGKYPAIRSFDVNNFRAPSQCVDHWNKGGLCMFGYHMGINGQSFNTRVNIDNVLKSGTSENNSFNQDLDRIAQYVQPLKDAGGVAIIRLFHEAGVVDCNWFWWSMGSSAQWQALFKYAFKYLTGTKGLNNTLWVAPLCGHPDAAYNPGSDYIDFGGADTYVKAGDYEPLTSLFHQTEAAFPDMMVALHECGSIPDPDQLRSTGSKWLFFNVWSGEYVNAPNNPASHLKAVYTNDYVITRDDLPSFK